MNESNPSTLWTSYYININIVTFGKRGGIYFHFHIGA